MPYAFNLDFTNKSICIIGDVMLDHYIHGTCSRISPEAPVPVVDVVKEVYTLGGAANVLKNIISLGAKADIISVTGDDDNAGVMIGELQRCQIDGLGLIKDVSRATTVKSRVIVANHQLIRLDHENRHPIDRGLENEVLRYFKDHIDEYQLILISDYNKGLLTPTLLNEILLLCQNKGIKAIVDPKGTDFSRYYNAYIIKPNKKEASLASGIEIVDNDTLKQACEKIQQLTNCTYLIITMSEDGIAVYSKDNLAIIPTKAQAIIDVTGAGDTVLAALGIAIIAGMPIDEACGFANHAAAVVINKIGSATVTMDEIEAFS